MFKVLILSQTALKQGWGTSYHGAQMQPSRPLWTLPKLHPCNLLCPRTEPSMPTLLEGAMDTLIKVFHHYSAKEGDKYKLNKGELKQLLTSELTDFLSCQKDPQLVDKIMQDLDSNKDNEVDFNEFVVLVAALTVACNDFFEEQMRKRGE
ncbi:protein S100-Z [Zootoca vivipara]|uniref:protein S100-Z n=2 Tax=Lacertinae TaxID=162266 RepID=UPI00159209BC|nr:protein S100-Z [Zootoca vivipara]XP_060136223.1 protein S100-Z [Zootoca vivipara]